MRGTSWTQGRRWLTAAVAGVVIAVAAGTTQALAITPFNGMACPPETNRTEAGLGTVFTSSATVTLGAGQTLTITVTNGASGTITSNGTMIINLSTGPTTATIVGPGTFVLNTPDLGGGALFPRTSGGGTMTISFDCAGAPVVTPPVTPPTTASPATDTAKAADGAAGGQADREPVRVDNLFGIAVDNLSRGVFSPSELLADLERQAEDLRKRILDDRFALGQPTFPGEGEALRDSIRDNNAKLDEIEREIDALKQTSPALQFAPQSRINPSVEAISQFFDFGGSGGTMSTPIQSTVSGWSFNLMLDGAQIDRASGGLTQQTMVGSATITGLHALDPDTMLGVGVKLGGSSSTANTPASTVNGMQVGADLTVVRLLSPNLFGGGYLGYEYGGYQATVTGIDSSFVTHTFKAGAMLEGRIDFETFTLTPSATALLQFRHRPSFTDAANVVIPSSDSIDFDVIAGATISRDFVFDEKEMVVTPFVTGNLVLDYETVTPALVGPALPGDPFRVQIVAGVKLRMDSGVTASIQGDISRGANTTMIGVTGSLNVPIN